MGVPDCSRVVHVEDEKLCLFSYSAVVYIIWKSPMYLIYVKEVALWD